MEGLQSILNNLNGYRKISDIEKNKKFEVLDLEIVETSFGERVRITTKDFQFLLPESWTSKITTECIEAMKKTKVYVEYKGTINLPKGFKKHNIIFSL
jgi:hypothetical protein